MDYLNLYVSGFYIRLRFRKTMFERIEKKMREDLKIAYRGFIYKTNPKKINYTITFIEKKKLDLDTVNKDNDLIYLIKLWLEKPSNEIITYYHISLFQFQFILERVVQNLLFNHSGFMLHASANLIKGKAVIFVGKSGAGKSTIMKLLHSQFPALADDTVIIKKESGKFYFYQTPFYEREWWINKQSKRLLIGGIYFLRKSKENKVKNNLNQNNIISSFTRGIFTSSESTKKQVIKGMDFLNHYDKLKYLYFEKNKNKLRSFFKNISN